MRLYTLPILFELPPVLLHKIRITLIIQNRSLKYTLQIIYSKLEAISINCFPEKAYTDKTYFYKLRKQLPNFDNMHRCNVPLFTNIVIASVIIELSEFQVQIIELHEVLNHDEITLLGVDQESRSISH